MSQLNASIQKIFVFRPIISLKPSFALLAAILAKWQGHIEIDILGFFCRNLEPTGFCTPARELVLSTDKPA